MPEREAPASAAAAAASEEGTPERKKARLKKRKKDKQQQGSSSAVSDDAGAAAAVDTDVVDGTGIVRAQEEGAPGDSNDIPERKGPKLKKRKKNKGQQQSRCAVSDADAVDTDVTYEPENVAEDPNDIPVKKMSKQKKQKKNKKKKELRKSGNVCRTLNGECAPGDPNDIPERKMSKLKKWKKNKRQQYPSAESDAGADVVDTDVADKSGNGCTNVEGAPGDADDIPEKKMSKRKKQKKSKKQQYPSVVSDAGADVVDTDVADKSGCDCTNVKGAPGGADDIPDRNMCKLKKRKKIKMQQSLSAVSDVEADVVGTDVADKSGCDCTNVKGALGDADDIPDRNMCKLKKRKKIKMQQSPSAVSDAGADVVGTDVADKSGCGCPNAEGAPGDGDVIMSPINGLDPKCPEVNSAEDSVKEKKENKDNSQSCRLLQDISLETKGREGKQRHRKKKNTNGINDVPDSSLQSRAVEAGLVTTTDENNTPASECKDAKKKRKRNQTGVTEAPLVEGAGETGSVGDVDDATQHLISEEEPDMLTKNKRSSICAYEGTTSNNANTKADCLHTKPQAHNERVQDIYSPRGSLIRFQRKKLLILDLNGLLADINQDHHNAHMADAKVRGKLVFKRPYYDDFLRFCFENFELGIWSSRLKANVDSVINILMKDRKQSLLFCWDMSKCTTTGCNTLENRHKPLVLKELKKLWNKEEPDLPWEQGEFSPSNTLLVDDSPYKALGNPPYTAIFPRPYSYRNRRDNSLGPGGDLRVYLENLAAADDIQCYVREHPFGQSSIVEGDRHWDFYAKILDKLDKPLAC